MLFIRYKEWRLGFGAHQYDRLQFHVSNHGVIHPEYKPGSRYNMNDIGILFLWTSITFTENITIGLLPPPEFENINIGATLYLTGFGPTSASDDTPDKLINGVQFVIDNRKRYPICQTNQI